jgi:hypothetical protein
LTALSQIAAGQRLTADMLQAVAPMSAYKSSNQTGSGSTLANDNTLFIPVLANAVYYFELILGYQGGTGGSSDIKLGWSLPSGATMVYALQGNTTGGAATAGAWETQSSVPALGTAGSGVPVGAVASGTIATGSTAGTMQLQWARNAGSGTSPTVLAGSVLTAWQVQ